ncbi:transcriptional regulator [Rhodoferax lacus]|uniref:Transcriptional regulator n=1 Tax=Rhodoferax lacus TaxID=2184758 RepID=A0A3E1REY0_9BURK|nr:SIS domain-containing protein [Rhodoferax lacus]RFO97823.1 transcriptional regulator [Rhodoferax lacus]
MLERISAALVSLSPAEQRVAQLVLSDPLTFSRLPVSELAALADVSAPTIVRFCRSLGYDGLKVFKSRLQGSMKEGVAHVHRSLHSDDKVNDILVKVIDDTMAALSTYRCNANRKKIESAVAALVFAHHNNKRIEIFGLGNSGIVAQDAQHKFFRLGVPSTAYVDVHMQVMSASVLRPGDCAIVISNSGRTRDLMESCAIANQNGATTIVITSSFSPLALAGRIHLEADHLEGFERYCPMVSRLLHLAIIDVVATSVALRIGMQDLAPSLKQMQSSLMDKRMY